MLKKALTFNQKKNRELQQAIAFKYPGFSHVAQQQLQAKNNEIESLRQRLLAAEKRHQSQISELNITLDRSYKKIDSLHLRLAAATRSGEESSKTLLAESQRKMAKLQQQIFQLTSERAEKKQDLAHITTPGANSAEQIKIQKLVAALAVSQQKLHEQSQLLTSRFAVKPVEKEKMAELIKRMVTLTSGLVQKDKELASTKQALANSQTNVDKLRQQLIAVTQKFTAWRQADTHSPDSQ